MENNETEMRTVLKYSRCSGHFVIYYLVSPVDGFYRYTYIFVVIMNILLSISGTIANVLVIAAYMKNNSLRTSSNYLIVVLAISDLMVTAFVQPLSVTKTLKEIFGTHNCVLWKVVTAMTVFCAIVSLLTITILSIERYITLAYPYRYQNIITPSRLKIATGLSWSLQLGVVISFVTPLSGIVLVLIETTIIAFSVSTVVAIWMWIHRLTRQHKTTIHNVQALSYLAYLRTSRTTKTSYLIVAAVLCCYFPLLVFSVFYSIEPNNFFLLFLIEPWTTTIVFANSTLNPVILFWRKSTFRESARKLLR